MSSGTCGGAGPGPVLPAPGIDPPRRACVGVGGDLPGHHDTAAPGYRLPMARSLVLNATFEPLAVVPARRAVVLVLGERADTVHAAGMVMHSERRSLEVPSVIRLRYFVRVPFGRRAPLSRRGVFVRDGFACQYCGRAAENIDHVVPRSRGGEHTWENVVACCSRCNTAKRDRLLSQTSMRLARQPVAPSPTAWVAFSVASVPAEWEPYLRAEPALTAAATPSGGVVGGPLAATTR